MFFMLFLFPMKKLSVLALGVALTGINGVCKRPGEGDTMVSWFPWFLALLAFLAFLAFLLSITAIFLGDDKRSKHVAFFIVELMKILRVRRKKR